MKWIKMAFCLICFLALTGCKKEEPKGTDLTLVETWITEQVDTILIDEGLDPLPTTYLDTGVTISWSSSNEKILNNEGKIVTRNTNKITEVDLTYTITNEAGDQKTNTIKVSVYPRTFGYISTRFKNQFPERLSETLEFLDVEISEFFTITWNSSDPTVLTNDGEYIQPQVDTPVVIEYRISATDEIYCDFSFEIIVLSASDEEKINRVSVWLENEIIPDLNISSSLNLPTTHPDYGTNITWRTSDETIITTDGKVTRYVFDRYVELYCTISLEDKSKEKAYWFKVEALDTTNMTEEEVLANFLSAIAVPQMSKLYFTEYDDITQTFNSLKFFDNIWEEQIEYITPLGVNGGYRNRPGTKKTSTEFIVVHDTANNRETAGGEAHARYVYNGGGGTSFHYAVGNDGIYHIIPNDEVAYHAGDGTNYDFKLYDTGVKATAERPHISIDSNGYFAFNGVSSNIAIPYGATVNSLIAPSGLYCEVGANGNYWLNENYFNTDFDYISNRGGNNNSVGIETCVDQKTDYIKTLRINADLVARLLIDYDLDVLRVIQHNNTAGKYCPAAMITANYWQNFRDLVSLEKFGMETFKDLTFEWVSKSDILSNDGYIKMDTGNATGVQYAVVVKRGNDVIYTQEYTTQLVK